MTTRYWSLEHNQYVNVYDHELNNITHNGFTLGYYGGIRFHALGFDLRQGDFIVEYDDGTIERYKPDNFNMMFSVDRPKV